MRLRKAGMENGELQKAAGSQDACGFSESAVLIGHVHERHEGGGEIERGIGERECRGVRDLVIDAPRIAFFFQPRMADERRRYVDGVDAGAAAGKLAGVGTLSAADVEAGKAAH